MKIEPRWALGIGAAIAGGWLMLLCCGGLAVIFAGRQPAAKPITEAEWRQALVSEQDFGRGESTTSLTPAAEVMPTPNGPPPWSRTRKPSPSPWPFRFIVACVMFTLCALAIALSCALAFCFRQTREAAGTVAQRFLRIMR